MLEKEMANRLAALESSTRIWKAVAICALLACIILIPLASLALALQIVDVTRKPGPLNANIKANPDSPEQAAVNYIKIKVLPENVVIDCGFNTQTDPDKEPDKTTQRLVVDWFTAKRFAVALSGTVSEHEKTFGPIELDFRNRMKK